MACGLGDASACGRGKDYSGPELGWLGEKIALVGCALSVTCGILVGVDAAKNGDQAGAALAVVPGGKWLKVGKGARAAKVETAIVPSAPFKLGQWGEARLAAELGGAGLKPRSPFNTSFGRRYVDRLVNGVAYEAKAGLDVGLTSSIRRQVLKDAELVATGQVRAAEWHFFRGAQSELLAFLRKNKIKYVVHP